MITAKDAVEELAVLKESAEGKTKEALSAAITAVGQNISKKPKLRFLKYFIDETDASELNAVDIISVCPSCGAEVKFKRCLDCGQVLDWSELEK